MKYGKHQKTGQWIAVPIGAPGQQIVYRESWVKEAGCNEFPKDIEGFIKLCKKLKSMGHPVGFALGHAVGDGNNFVHTWLWSFGAKTVNEDGSVAINSPETKAAIESMKELYMDAMIEGVASWLDPHNNKAFLADQISMTNNGISIYFAAKEKFPQIAEDTNHANLPIGPIGHPTELHLFDPAFIFKHTKYPNAAKHYLMFMLEEEQCGPWTNAMIGYVTPSLKAYRKLPVWTDDPKCTPYRDCLKNMLWNGYAGPIGPESAAVMAEYVVLDMFANVCARDISVDKAIADAEIAISPLLRKIKENPADNLKISGEVSILPFRKHGRSSPGTLDRKPRTGEQPVDSIEAMGPATTLGRFRQSWNRAVENPTFLGFLFVAPGRTHPSSLSRLSIFPGPLARLHGHRGGPAGALYRFYELHQSFNRSRFSPDGVQHLCLHGCGRGAEAGPGRWAGDRPEPGLQAQGAHAGHCAFTLDRADGAERHLLLVAVRLHVLRHFLGADQDGNYRGPDRFSWRALEREAIADRSQCMEGNPVFHHRASRRAPDDQPGPIRSRGDRRGGRLVPV